MSKTKAVVDRVRAYRPSSYRNPEQRSAAKLAASSNGEQMQRCHSV